MDIEQSILAAMVVWKRYTPLEIGDSIGEDKFRVLRLLRGLKAIGLVAEVPMMRLASSERDRADNQNFWPRSLACKVYSTRFTSATPTQ